MASIGNCFELTKDLECFVTAGLVQFDGFKNLMTEPNGPPLWAEVRLTITSFLETEYRAGSLLGSRPEEAYFVKCDRSTMTQNDLDEGLLVCLVGVAALRPAEFVVFRIGRWTADHRP